MDTALATPPLPSLSALTGSVPPSTASLHIEAKLQELKRKQKWPRSLSVDPDTFRRKSKPSLSEVGALSDVAQRHMAAISKTPGTPYQRMMTPGEREAIKKEVMQRLRTLADSMREVADAERAKSASAGGAGAAAEGGAAGAEGAAAAAAASGPGVSPGGGPDTRPSTSVSVQDLSLPRPASKLSRLKGLPGTPGGSRLAASWSGPLSGLKDQQDALDQQALPGLATPPRSRLATPSLRHPLRSSEPAPLLSFAGLANEDDAKSNGALSPISHPGTNRPNRASVYRSAGGTLPPLEVSDLPWVGAGPSPSRAQTAGGSPAPGTGHLGDPALRNRVVRTTALQPRADALQTFVPTRGMIYSVFTELDKAGSGHLTWSSFEDAAVTVGLKDDQARRLYEMLDPDHKGFVTASDWGNPKTQAQIAAFTRLYVQQTRGSSGVPQDMTQVRSLYMAMQMALTKLKLRNNGRSAILLEPKLLEAFRFIDTNGSGVLGQGELVDAFAGMGIYITREVVDEVMAAFDNGHSGAIEYNEFVRTLFPTINKTREH